MLTRQGWTIGFVGFAILTAGRLLGLVELYVLGVSVMALVAVALVSLRVRSLDISVERVVHPPKVHAGLASRVDLEVTNRGRRRTPVLSVRDAVSGTRGANLLLAPLEGGERTRAAYRLPTEKRGILRVGPLEVALGDAFGLTRTVIRASGVTELTVFPHVDDVAPVPLTTGTDPHAGAEHPHSLGRSGEDFYALRPYVVGDDLRRVHWPSTARHDELMVRQDDLPWQSRCTLLLDIRASSTDHDSLEAVISAAASIVTAGAARQDLIRVVTSGGDDSGFAAGHAHIDSVMEHLACVEASGEGFTAVVDRLSRAATGGSLVAIVAHTDPSQLEMVRRLRNRYGSVTVVRFDRRPWAPAGRGMVLNISDVHGEEFASTWNTVFRRRVMSA